MRVFIMTDLEGVARVMNAPDWIYPDSRYYETGKKLLTEETNAAIDGFFAAGATEVLVLDGHGKGAIDGLLLDERALLRRSRGYPFGVDGGFDCIAWVGQHPKAGTVRGHICHTGWMGVIDSSINGVSVGEFGECAFCAVEYGVTPIFGSGDKAFTKEAEALFPGIVTAAVKEGLREEPGDELTTDEYEYWNAWAIHQSHPAACRLIREKSEEALTRFREDPDSFSRTIPQPPYRMVTHYRPDKDHPASFWTVKEHPTSVTGLLKSPEQPLEV